MWLYCFRVSSSCRDLWWWRQRPRMNFGTYLKGARKTDTLPQQVRKNDIARIQKVNQGLIIVLMYNQIFGTKLNLFWNQALAYVKLSGILFFSEMNAESSRSHLILGIVIESTNLTSGAVVKGKVSNDWDFFQLGQSGCWMPLTRWSKFHGDQLLNSPSRKLSWFCNHMQCVLTNQNEGASFPATNRGKTNLLTQRFPGLAASTFSRACNLWRFFPRLLLFICFTCF